MHVFLLPGPGYVEARSLETAGHATARDVEACLARDP
jgi:hypothetical protein